MLTRNIKLIWDFRGPEGHRTATHHEKHLKEYIALEAYPYSITGASEITPMHSLAYMVVPEKDMITMRDALKPHRAEVYEGDLA